MVNPQDLGARLRSRFTNRHGLTPSPLWGEGWGEGEPNSVGCTPSPQPSPRRGEGAPPSLSIVNRLALVSEVSPPHPTASRRARRSTSPTRGGVKRRSARDRSSLHQLQVLEREAGNGLSGRGQDCVDDGG